MSHYPDSFSSLPSAPEKYKHNCKEQIHHASTHTQLHVHVQGTYNTYIPPTMSLVASVASRTWALLFGVTEPTNLTSPRHLPVGVRTQSMMKRYYRCGLIELQNSKIINRWRALTGRSFCFAVVRTRRRNLVRILACNETGITQLIF